MIVRRATLEDIDGLQAVLETHIAACGNFYPKTDRAAMAATILSLFHHTAPGVLFLATEGGDIIGMACARASRYLWSDKVQAEIVLVLVVPSHRGGRAFPKLMRVLDVWAMEKGCIEVSWTLASASGAGDERLAVHLEKRGWLRTGIDMVRALP